MSEGKAGLEVAREVDPDNHMNSKDLELYGISNWYAITSDNVPDVVAELPDLPGVYVFTSYVYIPRVRGESDIAYVGKGTGMGGVRQRVREHFYQRAEPTTSTPSGRIDQWINDWGYDVQVGYVVCESEDQAEDLEQELVEEYENDHHELPPITRTMPGGAAG